MSLFLIIILPTFKKEHIVFSSNFVNKNDEKFSFFSLVLIQIMHRCTTLIKTESLVKPGN